MAGPTEKNIDDFWRMVFQLKIQKIVMVTNCVEEGKVNNVTSIIIVWINAYLIYRAYRYVENRL